MDLLSHLNWSLTAPACAVYYLTVAFSDGGKEALIETAIILIS
ncbi:MAG: hypothetical protein ACI9UH_000165 [Gammaproteobacteria bacterium]|jgi:hypothetical protein